MIRSHDWHVLTRNFTRARGDSYHANIQQELEVYVKILHDFDVRKLVQRQIVRDNGSHSSCFNSHTSPNLAQMES